MHTSLVAVADEFEVNGEQAIGSYDEEAEVAEDIPFPIKLHLAFEENGIFGMYDLLLGQANNDASGLVRVIDNLYKRTAF